MSGLRRSRREEERRTRAVWVARTQGAVAALPVLGEPRTQDGALLRVGLYIETEQLAQARAALTHDPLIRAHDAEWHRLSACAAFYGGDRAAALGHCEQAEALSPDNVAVLEVGAVIRYGLALSPAANFRFSDGPEASQVDFGLTDDVSQAHVRKALALFDRLAERAMTPFQKGRVGLWRLACLALMPHQGKDVKSECLRLISAQPPCPGRPVVWGVGAGGVEFDPEEVARRLWQQLDSAPDSMDALQALIMMRIFLGERAQALELLQRYAPGISNPLERRHLEYLCARLSRRGRRGRPRGAADAGPYEELLSLVKAKWTGQQARAIDDYLTERAPPANVVMVGCLILASHNEWRHIVPHVARLLAEVANAEAVRLSTYARYNTGDYPGALAVLEDAGDKFPAGKLPPDLLRIQAVSAGHEGKFAQALPLAHELAAYTGRPGDQLLYSELAVRSGNIAQAVPFIRQLHESGAVPGGRLMAFIPVVSTTDPALARSLLTQVTASDIPIEVGGTLLDWHYRLGMESQAHALFQRLMALQPKGKRRPLRRVPLSQIGRYLRQRQQLRADLDARLRQDGGPIHVVAGALGANLAEVWEQAFRDRDTALLIRSANRPSVARFEPPPRSLALDITAVLTTEQLGLTDTLLASSIELELPASLMELLNVLEQGLPHHQPARLVTLQNIADAAGSARLKVWSGTTVLPEKSVRVAFETLPGKGQPGQEKGGARRQGGPTATGASAQSGHTASPPPADVQAQAQAVAQLASIGEELVRSGRLSLEGLTQLRTEYADWRSIGTSRPVPDFEHSQALLFEANTIESVFRARLEEAAAQRWQLWIEEEHLRRIHAELTASRAAQAFAERIRQLREQLAKAIRDGRVRVLPARWDGAGQSLDAPHALIRPLSELLTLPTSPERWLWIDDRYCTGYGSANQTPIATTVEVLTLLEQQGVIDAPKRYALLLKLREACAQYVPLELDELMHWLARAEEREGKLIETSALKILRRSFNTFAALIKDLRTRPGPNDLGRELSCAASSSQSRCCARGCRRSGNVAGMPWAFAARAPSGCGAHCDWRSP